MPRFATLKSAISADLRDFNVRIVDDILSSGDPPFIATLNPELYASE